MDAYNLDFKILKKLYSFLKLLAKKKILIMPKFFRVFQGSDLKIMDLRNLFVTLVQLIYKLYKNFGYL